MLRISKIKDGYEIEGIDEDGARALGSPIHRLFLGSNLAGTQQRESTIWLIPSGDDEIATLVRLRKHFERYVYPIELDAATSELLAANEAIQREYRIILSAGVTAKRSLAPRRKSELLASLRLIFHRRLTDPQLQGLSHLLAIHNGANLSVPGSGKTSVVLAYFAILRKNKEIDAIFVIGPGSSFEPWETETTACFARKPRILRVAGQPSIERKQSLLLADMHDILLTTYQSAARDMKEIIQTLRRRRYLLVLDESHYVKRPQGGVLAETVLDLAPYAVRRVILTGTPMPNGLADLWTQFTFLWPKQLPLGQSNTYLNDIQRQPKESSIANVRQTLAPFFYRTTKSQLGLPPPTFLIHKCAMSPLQARIYRGVAARLLVEVSEAPHEREALREWRRARAIRLLQIASNPTLLRRSCDEFRIPPLDASDVSLRDAIQYYARYETPGKVAFACELAREICASGRKAIIWSTFVHNLIMIAESLRELSPVVIHGAIPLASNSEDELNREHLIHQFKNDPTVQVLVANPAACAESISLHKTCHDAVYLDRSFNCAHYLQSLDRIHRLGLPRNAKTRYHVLLARGSIDEVVDCRLREKMRRMRQVVESRFSTDVPGYWSEDLGDQEVRDSELVEKHIRFVGDSC